jgi:hypothetical protein
LESCTHPPTLLLQGRSHSRGTPHTCYWRGCSMLPVGSWIFVGVGCMGFMTTLINSTSLLAWCSRSECYSPRWGWCNPLEEAGEEVFRLRLSAQRKCFAMCKGVVISRHLSYRCREGCLVLSASVTRLCSYVGCDVSWSLSPPLLDLSIVWPLGRSRQRT